MQAVVTFSNAGCPDGNSVYLCAPSVYLCAPDCREAALLLEVAPLPRYLQKLHFI